MISSGRRGIILAADRTGPGAAPRSAESGGIKRALVVGLGSIGLRHARLLRELLPEAELVALRHDPSKIGGSGGVDRSLHTIEEALRARPQIAVIASPATRHLDAALPLAQAGVHLLIEKPIAADVEGVAELIDVCAARGVVLMTGYNLRFLNSLRTFRELLSGGRVGRVLSVRAEVGQYLPAWRPSADYRVGVSASSSLGGGVLLELSHDIDYLRWLFGEIEWVSGIQRKQSALDMDVDDTAHLTFGFASAGSTAPLVASLNMDFIRHDACRTCTAIGETGTLRWDARRGTVDVYDEGSTDWVSLFVEEPERDESYRAQLLHFLSCIAGDASPLVPGEEGLAALSVAAACRESSRSGMVVPVNTERLRHAPAGTPT